MVKCMLLTFSMIVFRCSILTDGLSVTLLMVGCQVDGRFSFLLVLLHLTCQVMPVTAATGYGSSPAVVVFTPNGQFVRQYNVAVFTSLQAIDPSSYSIVTSSSTFFVNGSLFVFDPSGRQVHLVEGLNAPHGVAVLPDGSV